MNWEPFASRISFVSLTDTNPQDIANGDKIRVYGFIVAELSGAAKTITLRSADGTVTYANIRLAANQTFQADSKFIADAGLEVVASAGNAAVTVFHNNPGN